MSTPAIIKRMSVCPLEEEEEELVVVVVVVLVGVEVALSSLVVLDDSSDVVIFVSFADASSVTLFGCELLEGVKEPFGVAP